MTSRELRTRRRAAERRARKEASRPLAPATPSPCLADLAHSDDEGVVDPAQPLGFVFHNDETGVPTPRALTNRRNAQNSSGPRTPVGKLASSRNSTKHGLASSVLLIPGEDPAALAALQAAFLDEYQPANPTEHILIEEMAQSHWLTQRALRLQNECFSSEGVDTKGLALFLRYQSTHQRAFHRALNTLLALQRSRRKTTVGFVSQPIPKTAEPDAAARPKAGFVSQTASVAPPTHPKALPQAA